jgi:DNA-binding NtrC family response regulator
MEPEDATMSERENERPVDALLEGLYRNAVEREGARGLRLREWVERAEAWRIAQVLRECRGNRTAAARALGIGRRTLYSKLERLGLEPRWGASSPCGRG